MLGYFFHGQQNEAALNEWKTAHQIIKQFNNYTLYSAVLRKEGAFWKRQKKYDMALKCFNQALNKFPNDPLGLTLRASVLLAGSI